MVIKNPVLRFFAGLAVTSGSISLAVFFFAGLGRLLEANFASTYPSLYAVGGYPFWTAFWYGFGKFALLSALGAAGFLGFCAVYSISKRLFGPRQEERDAAEVDISQIP